jgi:hypothetical protein
LLRRALGVGRAYPVNPNQMAVRQYIGIVHKDGGGAYWDEGWVVKEVYDTMPSIELLLVYETLDKKA